MRHTKITIFIAVTALSAFLLAWSFTPLAGGETRDAGAPNIQSETTSAPAPGHVVVPRFNSSLAHAGEDAAAIQAARVVLQRAFDTGNFEMMSSARQNALLLQARVRYDGFVVKEMGALPAASRELPPVSALSSLIEAPDALPNPTVNDPTLDTTSQNTQSETTVILTGANTLVSAYNDSGSFTGGNKFTGYSTSTDGGASWTDRGTVPEAVFGNFGDPVLARNKTTGKVFLSTLAANTNGQDVYSSTDNGVTWNGPVNGAPGTASGDGDKEWITVDNFVGAGNGNVYLAYRDFGATHPGVLFTRSTDNGATFGPNPGLLISNVGTVQGAWVFVGSDHAVYVGFYNAGSIRVRKSTDQGLTFATPVTVANLITTGTNGSLNVPAGYRSSAFPQFVASPINPNLIFSIHPDITVAGGSDSNCFMNQSTDGGATWSANLRLNADAGTNVQNQPALAVMPDGSALCVTWQDSRADVANRKVQRFGVIGTIAGNIVTFGSNFIVSAPTWTPVFGQDPVVNSVYMGDYDHMEADNSFFYTTFVDCRLGNQDVRFAKIPKAGPIPSPVVNVQSFNPTTIAVAPNSCNNLFVTLSNDGDLVATAVSLSLTTSTPGVTILASPQSYGNIAPGGTATNATPFKLSIANTFVCGTSIVINWTASTGETGSFTVLTQGVGYSFSPSTGNSIVPGTTDIGVHTDDGITFVALPFTFNYYGVPFTGANVGTNGNLQFTSSSTAFTNICPLPTNTFNNPVMPFWDDLITDPAGNGMFTSTSGSAPNRIFNIEWRATYISTTTPVNFEIRLYETTNQIDFVYGVLNGTGSSATVGLQKGTGAGGPSDVSSFSCNTGSLSNGLKITWLFSTTCPQGPGFCGAPTPTPSPTPSITPGITPTPPPTPTPTPTPTSTPTPSPSPTPCNITTFSNPAAITINDAGVAAPYPSNITVSGVTNPVASVTVTLTGFSHTFPSDVDVLLVGPGGQKFILVSDVIGGTDAVGINWTFDDTAAAFIGSTGTPASGTFKPTNYTVCQDPFAAPAPAGPYLTPGGIGTPCGTDTLAAFNGVNPNGTWSLYVVDDLGADVGTISGGWSLAIGTSGGCGTPTPSPTVTPGTPSPTPSSTPCSGGADVIVDGGFENGGIPSSTWDPETSTNFGTPLCDFASCGNGGGASPPRTGLIWAWFGGIAAPETATLGQTVTIPSGGPATLHFWMRIGTVTTPFTDVMNVRVDGTIVQSYLEPATAEADYTERVIDLTAFANGASHALLFEYIGPSTGTGSYVVDDVSLIAGGACASATPSIPPSATPTPSASPSCSPSWLAGPAFPAVGAVRAPGNYFPANGRFYAIGGRSSDTAGSDFTNPFEYNPGTNAWTTKPSPLPDNQVNNMACGVLTVSGTPQVYCVGGSAAGATTATARVFSYNPATDTFTVLAAGDNWPGDAGGNVLPGGFAVAGNKLYIFGGFTIGADATAQTWQFDPTLGVGAKWLQRQDLPLARGYVPAASIGGMIYTGGGAMIVAATLTDSVDSFKYDPVANTWAAIANIPRATGETRAVVMNGQMWVLGGGRVTPNPSNEVDIYNPGTNSWSVGLPFGSVRRNFPADSDGTTRIFLAGGYDSTGTGLQNTMEIFAPGGACASPTPPPTTPTPTPTLTPPPPTPTLTPPPPTPTVTPPPATPTPTLTPGTPTPTPPTTPTPTPGVSPPAQAVNFSTRMHVEGGDKVGIGGFIVTGVAPKRVIVRAIGPSLTRYGLTDVLADPVLELHGPTGFVTITNDNWRDTQEAEIQATGLPPTNNLESAIVATLAPGNYTGIVRANGPTPLARSGLALIEVYDLAQNLGKLGNISTRAFCSTGDNIIIAGFILGNNGGNDNVIARGMGPSLASQGVPTPLANPTLQLRDANGALLASDNDWQDNPAQAAIISAAGLAPGNDLEAAIAATLPPGLYTALLAGLNNGTGIGLVEVYDRGDGTGGPPVPTPTPGITPVPSPTPSPGVPTPTPSVPPPTPTPPPASPTPTPAVACTESFDGVTPPALPNGWSQTIVTGPPPGWATSVGVPDTLNNAFVADTAVISDKVLDRAGVVINSAAPVLSFRNNFDTEFSDGTYWDGGVLEVSSPNINGGAFTDVTNAAVGGSFVTGEYTGTIDNTANNPLADRDAWSGSSGGYINTVINMGPNLNGQTVTLRWRIGTDEAVGAPGWRIDTLNIVGGSCP